MRQPSKSNEEIVNELAARMHAIDCNHWGECYIEGEVVDELSSWLLAILEAKDADGEKAVKEAVKQFYMKQVSMDTISYLYEQAQKHDEATFMRLYIDKLNEALTPPDVISKDN